ncbi:MAG: hypothetical protein A2138_17855 [Deltaproteobacteria bacterium RBG_16_71_12]|nr:MAG: hypothetical protein A2138_17855 [Deltaproteobacteria bacterium RBG_16_71_12]
MALQGTKNGGGRVLPKPLVQGGDVEVNQTGAVTSTKVNDKAADDDKQAVAEGGSFGQVADAKRPSAGGAVLGAQKPWQTRLDPMKKSDALVVAQAVLAVMSGVPADVLTEPTRSAVLDMVKDDGGKAADAAAMKRVYQRCMASLDPEAVTEALGKLALAANDAAHAVVTATPHQDEVPEGKTEKRDWHRTWGLRLLPDDDPAFRDPAYLVALNQESQGIRATTYEGRTSVTSAREQFANEWQKLAPNTKLLAFTDSGSDSVSLCFQLALALGRRRLGDAGAKPGLAFFSGSYGGGRGLASSMNFAGWGRYVSEDKEEFKLPAATSTSRNPTGDELKRVQKEEADALMLIELMATDTKSPIGAIFLEPVQGANSVQFYRTEFLLELRKLADKHGLPIIADEVLTGGGRTGKFFAFENYPGFAPDFVVFGKGLQTSGIAAVAREGQLSSQQPHEFDLGVTTAGGDAVRFLKGAQVMKRIREGGLLEQSADVGAYLLERLKEVQQFHNVPVDASGMGLLLGMSKVDGSKSQVSEAWGNLRTRYLPPLTLTRDDVDLVIRDLLRELPSEVLADLKARRELLQKDLLELPTVKDIPDGLRKVLLESSTKRLAEVEAAIVDREAELAAVRAKVKP